MICENRKNHVTQVAEGSYHLQLTRSDLISLCGLPSIGQAFPMQTYNQDLVSVIVACRIFYAPKVCSHCSRCCCCLLLYDKTAHGYSPELCKRSRSVSQIMTFVFPAFTLSPFFSVASFHIKSLLTHSSRESAMMTRSSAYRFSQVTPSRNSRDKASSTMMKSKGLSMDP